MAHILIVDDDDLLQELLSAYVLSTGNTPAAAGCLEDAFESAGRQPIDMVFLDVRLPDGNGLDALSRFRRLPSEPEVVIITGVGDAEGAEMAINSGAWDYLQKPVARNEVILQITRALEFREKRQESRTISLKRREIIGGSQALSQCLDLIAQAAPTDANVLITGETGTGKELFARTIHENSHRAHHDLVVVDCAAMPETLIESSLFGHARGAFTGADKDRPGLVAQADRGTLFLDEIGELPPAIQKTFLRVLQERRYTPVGHTREVKSDFRLIAATNRNLEAMVAGDLFRSDLLFRLRTFHIDLPPLRRRREDIRPLALHFISAICEANGLGVKGCVPEFLDLLMAHDWPGNVRELYHTLEQAVLADPGTPTLYPRHLPPEVRIRYVRRRIHDQADDGLPPPSPSDTGGDGPGKAAPTDGVPDLGTFMHGMPPMKTFRERLVSEGERQYLNRLLAHTGHDIKKAIRVSGVGQARLYALLKKHGFSTKQR